MNVCCRCGNIATYITKDKRFVCNKNGSKCPAIQEQLSLARLGRPAWNKDKKQITPAWNKGLTKETDERILALSNKWKENYKNSKFTLRGYARSAEAEAQRRKKLSDHIKKRYSDGWMPKAGRCKKYIYSSNIAGTVLLDGTWELATAKYFDDNNIKWIRNTKKFKYTNLTGRISTYTPDFYLEESDLYVEVKGYTTKLDICKWTQFKFKLEVWDKTKLSELNII